MLDGRWADGRPRDGDAKDVDKLATRPMTVVRGFLDVHSG